MIEHLKFKSHLLIILLIISFSCFAEPNAIDLEGTWKIEDKESFEHWERMPNGNLIGESYNEVLGNRVVLETLLLRIDVEKTTYEATVADQNDGQTVAFTLNDSVKHALSFENSSHDFPTRIVYKFESPQRLFVEVRGPDGNGFSFFMDRLD